MSRSPGRNEQVGKRIGVKFKKQTRARLHRFHGSGKNLGFYSKSQNSKKKHGRVLSRGVLSNLAF